MITAKRVLDKCMGKNKRICRKCSGKGCRRCGGTGYIESPDRSVEYSDPLDKPEKYRRLG